MKKIPSADEFDALKMNTSELVYILEVARDNKNQHAVKLNTPKTLLNVSKSKKVQEIIRNIASQEIKVTNDQNREFLVSHNTMISQTLCTARRAPGRNIMRFWSLQKKIREKEV